jgi:hypothetical protein
MMKRTAIVFTALAVVGLVSPAAAQDGSDDAGVDVTVSEVTNVDINPTQLNYGTSSTLEPRDFAASSDNRDFPGIQVENSGSNNITQLSIETSEPYDKPFGSGFSQEYDAGNFIKVRPQSGVTDIDLQTPGGDGTIGGTEPGDNSGGGINTDETGYHYPARIDFNATGKPLGEPQALTYIDVPDTSDKPYRYGRFRDGEEEFFWAVQTEGGTDSDANICDNGPAKLRVGNNPHTDSAIGTTDFTDDNSNNFAEYDLTDDGEGSDVFGRAEEVELNTSEGNTSYTVLSYCSGSGDSSAADDQTFLVRTRYDLNPFADVAGDTPTGTNGFPTTTTLNTTATGVNGVEALIETDESGDPMHPGQSFTLFTAVEIPRGVASGSVGPGTLSIVASSPEA